MSNPSVLNLNGITHDEARAKIGQRVVSLKEGKGQKPTIYIGYVVAVELPFIYSGPGSEAPGEPALLIEWEGVAEVDSLSWQEYQQDLQEI
jgi:hypothetical protein